MIFLTSDTHFGHAMMAKMRGHSSIDAMNESIVERWNEVVRTTDEVLHLGDFSFAGTTRTLEILARLNGRITLVPGNHDAPSMLRRLAEAGVAVAEPLIRRKLWTDRPRATLCHYPLLTWPSSHHGAWHFHGHSHGNLEAQYTSTRIDVGWDCFNDPVSLDVLEDLMKRRRYTPVDHHIEGEAAEQAPVCAECGGRRRVACTHDECLDAECRPCSRCMHLTEEA